jgi:hypothetical protein
MVARAASGAVVISTWSTAIRITYEIARSATVTTRPSTTTISNRSWARLELVSAEVERGSVHGIGLPPAPTANPVSALLRSIAIWIRPSEVCIRITPTSTLGRRARRACSECRFRSTIARIAMTTTTRASRASPARLAAWFRPASAALAVSGWEPGRDTSTVLKR